jgi:hypothetical protein
VTVDIVDPVSNGSVHHCDVGRDDGGGAASGASSGDPVKAISTNMPPSARNGTTTTAPKHPRPLRGSSRWLIWDTPPNGDDCSILLIVHKEQSVTVL